MCPARDYVRDAISNGNPLEQALIRKWWYEQHAARGAIVWEYYLEGRFLDAIWFPDEDGNGVEHSGTQTQSRFPLAGREVVLCEAKLRLTPELVGQALVYRRFVTHADAIIKETVIFSANADDSILLAAKELGLSAVVYAVNR
jgi:hypothetical protein